MYFTSTGKVFCSSSIFSTAVTAQWPFFEHSITSEDLHKIQEGCISNNYQYSSCFVKTIIALHSLKCTLICYSNSLFQLVGSFLTEKKVERGMKFCTCSNTPVHLDKTCGNHQDVYSYHILQVCVISLPPALPTCYKQSCNL